MIVTNVVSGGNFSTIFFLAFGTMGQFFNGHFTIIHLKKNVLADESRLYIFCDAPKTEADRAKVEEVGRLLKKHPALKR